MNETSTKVTPEYRAAITTWANERNTQRFLNDSCDHAQLLASLMIGRADKNDDVLIYSEKLPSSCFFEALSSSKSSNIRIVVENATGLEEIKKLPQDIQNRVACRLAKAADGAHFWIAGDAFRLELNHDKATAVASFNDPEAIAKLRSRFERLWTSANKSK